MPTSRWKMNRAKFFNFWYYPEEDFFMEGGRTLFRGHNGSGKSVTTQSLITVLLDGDVSAKRLDPFAQRERNIRDTLLGEAGLLGLEERIGYVVLEFKKENAEIYKTIGMGVEARRGTSKPTKVWYFILNGKRIGHGPHNFRLYNEEKIDGKMKRIPLTDSEIRDILMKEGVGKFYSHKDDYAEDVNKQLFGFESKESYQNFIKLLIQARNPKLSDTANMDSLSEVISNSLPPNEEEELRPMQETIETIQQMEQDLAAFNTDLQAMMKLEKAYRHYHMLALAEKSVEFQAAKKKLYDAEKQKQSYIKTIDGNKVKIDKLESEVIRLRGVFQACMDEKTSLSNHEVYDLQEKKEGHQRDKKEADDRLVVIQEELRKAEAAARQSKRKADDANYQIQKFERQSAEAIEELEQLASECHFSASETWLAHYENADDDYSFSAWQAEFDNHKNFLTTTRDKLLQHEQFVRNCRDAEESMGQAQQNLDQSEREIARINSEMDKEEQAVVEHIQVWFDDLRELPLPVEASHRLMAGVATADITPHDTYFKEVNELHGASHHELVEAQIEKNHAQQKLTAEIGVVDSEIFKWRNERDIVPLLTEKKKSDWAVLYSEGIPFVPFYEACEFKEEVTEETRLRIQDALSELGLLTAVIVPEENVASASLYTAVIQPSEKQTNNLTAYLIPATGGEIPFRTIECVLEGISVDDASKSYISQNGSFQTEWLAGKATAVEEGLFIGKGAREMLRRAKIESLEAKLASFRGQQEVLSLALSLINERRARLDFEKSSFPSLDPYRALGDQKRRKKIEVESLSNDFKNKRDRYIKAKQEADALLTSIRSGIEFIDIPLNALAYNEALQKAYAYEKHLRKLEDSYKDQVREKKLLESYETQLDRAEESGEKLCDEQTTNDRASKAAQQKIHAMDEALRAKGADDIQRRLSELNKQIEEIPHTQDGLTRESTSLLNETNTMETRLTRLINKDIPFQQDVLAEWKNSLDEHRKLGVFSADEEGIDLLEMAFEEAAEYLYQKLQANHDVNRENITKATDDLQDVFNKQSMVLQHYSLSREPVKSEAFEAYDLENEHADLKLSINAMREHMGRIQVRVEVSGKRVSPSSACMHLMRKIEELNVQAGEKDRELYERFLMNTISDSIRRKIHYVRNWEKEINRFLDQEDMIKFRLKWVPKEREGEDELNTKELVDMLTRDEQWIDKTKIAKHFRAKIKQAKRKYEQENPEGKLSMKYVIAEVMDYRKWYVFELYFTKPGDQEFPLTKKNVAKLSGGQQVLSMVAPILAALHAKYLEANEETVRIFTLDEAFTRVDDENKEAMFEYVRNLDFDYIINSQELWGTYATVPDLNIFDLSRPKNRPSVSVIAYHWNGNTSVRTRILPEEKLASISLSQNAQGA